MSKRFLCIVWEGVVVTDSSEPSFMPRVIAALARISEQTDLTLCFIERSSGTFTQTVQLLEILRTEGIRFETRSLSSLADSNSTKTCNILVCRRPEDAAAANALGTRVILFGAEDAKSTSIEFCSEHWPAIAEYICLPARCSQITRKTNETDIDISLNLDGSGKGEYQTGIGFFDHMLEQLSRHASLDLRVIVRGDTHVDEHHTIEDTAIALGEAFNQALGDKRGIARYGFLLPMDDCLAQVAIDFSGRSWLVWDAEFTREKIGEMPTEMFHHFFKSFSDSAKCNLNIKAEGSNEHHKIEAIFKAWAKAIKMALLRDSSNMKIPSTKGVL